MTGDAKREHPRMRLSQLHDMICYLEPGQRTELAEVQINIPIPSGVVSAEIAQSSHVTYNGNITFERRRDPKEGVKRYSFTSGTCSGLINVRSWQIGRDYVAGLLDDLEKEVRVSVL